jgi:hypothetical protein
MRWKLSGWPAKVSTFATAVKGRARFGVWAMHGQWCGNRRDRPRTVLPIASAGDEATDSAMAARAAIS